METLIINIFTSGPMPCSNPKCGSRVREGLDSVIVIRKGKSVVFCSSECLVEACMEAADRQIMRAEGKKRNLLKELRYKRQWGVATSLQERKE